MTRVRPDKTTAADRAWLAYHCLPRDEKGRLPALTALEKTVKLGRGTLSRFFSGERIPTPKNLEKAAAALQVPSAWLAFGEGHAPRLTGPLPPRPGTTTHGWQVETPMPERWVDKPVRYENLRRVVTSLRGTRPDEFLDEVLVSAALHSPTDLPEASWMAMLDGLYARWRGKAVPERERPDDDDDPIAASMDAARKKHAKKKSRVR